MTMSPLHGPNLQPKLQLFSRATRRDRSRSRRPRLSPSLRQPQHLRQLNRDDERPAVVAAGVVADLVRGRQRRRPHQQSQQNHPR